MFCRGTDQVLCLRGSLRLGKDPDTGLRSGEADDDPAILQIDFAAVEETDFLHLQGQGGKLAADHDLLLDALAAFGGQGPVELRHVRFAKALIDLQDQFAHGFAGDAEHLQQEGGSIEAVLAVDVAADGQAS